MTIEAQVSSVDGVAVVCFKDLRLVIDEDRFEQVEQELQAIVAQEHSTPIILDFESKEVPTCHVVQCLLLKLHMRLEGNLKLCNLPSMAVWHFEFNGLADRLNIYPTRKDALAATKS